MSKAHDMVARRNTLRSLCALITISLWVHFLAASAPHRVHHLLENLPRRGQVPHQQPNNEKIVEPTVLRAADNAKRTTKPPSEHHRHDHRHGGHTHEHHHNHGQAAIPPVETINQTDTAVAPRQTSAPRRDRQHDSSAQNDCLVQAAAQHSQIGQVACIGVVAVKTTRLDGLPRQDLTFAYFDPSPFSQRAPPNP